MRKAEARGAQADRHKNPDARVYDAMMDRVMDTRAFRDGRITRDELQARYEAADATLWGDRDNAAKAAIDLRVKSMHHFLEGMDPDKDLEALDAVYAATSPYLGDGFKADAAGAMIDTVRAVDAAVNARVQARDDHGNQRITRAELQHTYETTRDQLLVSKEAPRAQWGSGGQA